MDILSILLFETETQYQLANMRHQQEQILTRLHKVGLRITAQRRCLVQQILRAPGHFSADELLTMLRNRQMEVSRATLYRLLPALVQIGTLREVIHTEGHRHYELMEVEQHHEHLICECCGKIMEFTCPALEGALADVCREHSFSHHTHTVEITGLCKACQREAKRVRRPR